jgi:chaperone BCS1
MDDKDLMDAFSGIPFRSVLLLEDIDCAGADVEDRDTKKSDTEKAQEQVPPSATSDPMHNSMFQLFLSQQALGQQQIFGEVQSFKQTLLPLMQELGIAESSLRSNLAQFITKANPNKKVSLSGLLNVIDGADAAEGRLLIITTNCPEKLDPALLRAGRCDEKFKIDFATKVTSALTFKRIFGVEKDPKHKPATIDRFAKAFSAQFPSRSKISTAELAKYCGQYRSRPEKAVDHFPEWLELGNDKFAYRLENATSDKEAGFNIPEEFDSALLQLTPEDLAGSDTKASTTISALVIQTVASTSSWNPFRWGRGANTDDAFSVSSDLPVPKGTTPEDTSVLDGLRQSQDPAFAVTAPQSHQSDREAKISAIYQSFGCVTRGPKQDSHSDIDINLEDILDDLDVVWMIF